MEELEDIKDHNLKVHYVKEIPVSITSEFDETKIIRKDLWGGGYILQNALSEKECQYFIDEAEKLKWEVLNWEQGKGNDYRVNDRVMIMNEEIGKFFWNRFGKFMLGKDDNGIGKDITRKITPSDGLYKRVGSPCGVWRPIGLNPRFRICKYFKGGLFKKHYDGAYVINDIKRSLYTFMFYLNDNYTGGETNILEDSNLHNIVDVVGPLKTGNLVIFPQDLYHEGTPVIEGVKYIMRTDVLFEKVSDIDQSELTEPIDTYLEAERILVTAEELERNGNIDESIKMYKKAFSMSPTLASKYGF